MPLPSQDVRVHDALIIGAGPVGLTLAHELARRGVAPLVIDRASGIREVSKALILHVRTQEALASMGLTQALRAEAEPLTEIVVHAYGKHVGSWHMDGIDSAAPHPLILGQNRTQHLLLDGLARHGGEVHWGVEATTLEVRDDGASATLRGPDGTETTVEARYVVGCEGSNSLTRKTLGLNFEGERYSGEQFIQADCRLRWRLPSGRSYLFLTADGYMMAIEMPGGVTRIFISLPDDSAAGAAAAAAQLGAVEAVHEQPTLDEIAGHLTRLTGIACELSDPVWLARYRTSHRYADRFQARAGFVAGDAAHVHVPIGGQGMNTGVQDAFNLGWKLAGVLKGELTAPVLDSYSAERHPVAAGLIRGTDLAYRGVLRPSEFRQNMARLLGPFLVRSETVQTFVRNTLEELKIAYPDSPLNFDAGGAGGPAPGERTLDATVVSGESGATTRISALSAGPAWTLLLFAADTASLSEAVAVAGEAKRRFGVGVEARIVWPSHDRPNGVDEAALLFDPLREAHRKYGVQSPAIFLLRPDTFVGARAPLRRWPDLAAHIAKFLVAAT